MVTKIKFISAQNIPNLERKVNNFTLVHVIFSVQYITNVDLPTVLVMYDTRPLEDIINK